MHMEVQSCVNENGCNLLCCILIKWYVTFACVLCISSLSFQFESGLSVSTPKTTFQQRRSREEDEVAHCA